jgi:hypothetical protein
MCVAPCFRNSAGDVPVHFRNALLKFPAADDERRALIEYLKTL